MRASDHTFYLPFADLLVAYTLAGSAFFAAEMSRRNIAIVLVMGLFALLVYVASSWNATTSGIETKGSDASLAVQYLSLATAIVSLLTAIVGLLKGTVKKGSSADT
jgi:uncharacterized membrane protein YidH (DUF202 family)